MMQNFSAGRNLVLVTSSAGSDQRLEGIVSPAGSGKGGLFPSWPLDQSRREKPRPACSLGASKPAVNWWGHLDRVVMGHACFSCLLGRLLYALRVVQILDPIYLIPLLRIWSFWPYTEGPLCHFLVMVKAFLWHLSIEGWSCGPSFCLWVAPQGRCGEGGH